MNTLDELWAKLEDKDYREEFVSAQAKRAIPFQIRAMLKDREWTQARLAEESGVEQGVISRAANPNYGNLSINTIIRIAAGFDVAFIGKFVPFSELGNWFLDVSETELGRVPSFMEEAISRGRLKSAAASASGQVVIAVGTAGQHGLLCESRVGGIASVRPATGASAQAELNQQIIGAGARKGMGLAA